MRYIRLALILMVCAGLMVSVSPTVGASERVPTMTVSELKDGMRGIGRTVIAGTKIEAFNFEIVGVMQKGGFNGGPMIIVRVWGPVIDASGGIAGGYSGSPMYIDGKLIGALSAGWFFTDGDLAGVTPIHEMLKTFNYPETPGFWRDGGGGGGFFSETKLDKPIIHNGQEFGKVLIAGDENEVDDREVSDDTLVLVASKTPLIVGGISDKYFNLIKGEMERRMPYVEFIQGPGSGDLPTNLNGKRLDPGAAIGVQLVSGDIDMTAIGTLSYVDDQGRFLAFGHPFMQAGYVEMPLTSARIVKTVPSMQRSFKMGESIELVGRIEQDRATCVAGHFGATPDMLDIKVTVYDEDLDWKNTYDCRAIRDKDMMSIFWLLAPLEAVMRTMDRAGGGLMEVSFKVDAEGFDKPIAMENIYYSPDASLSWLAVNELSMVLDGLTNRNIFRDAKVNSIEMDITVRDENLTQNIVKARSIMPPKKEEEEEEEASEDTGGDNGGETARACEFIRRNIPDRALMSFASTGLGRRIIKLNAGEEVLKAVQEYTESAKKEEEKEFYEVPQYYPGDSIEVSVVIQPYREDPFTQIIKLEIPGEFPPGQYDVSISGGGYFFGNGFMGMDMGMMFAFGGFGGGGYYGGNGPETLEEMIDEMVDREPNNALVLSLAPIQDEDPYAYLRDDFEPPEPIKSVIHMAGPVYGSFFLPIEVLAEDDEEYDESEGEPPGEFPGMSEGKIVEMPMGEIAEE